MLPRRNRTLLPPGVRRTLLRVLILILSAPVLIWPIMCAAPEMFISHKPYTKKVALAEGVWIIEEHDVETAPFWGIEGVLIPAPPTSHDLVSSTELFANERSLGRFGEFAKFDISPDAKRVLVEPGLHAKPFLIVEVENGNRVEVPVSAGIPDGHDYVYPLTFIRWTDDSSSVLTQVTGAYVDEKRGLLGYRELWTVDAASGTATRTRRDEQPWSEHLNWSRP
jgi:hypothetical protein